MATLAYSSASTAHGPVANGSRLQSIDALRGLVMVIMLLDHVRETWFLYTPWFVVPGEPLRTVMSFLALTKYPPSLLFLLPTLGIGLLLIAAFERANDTRLTHWLAAMGGAPMFFYLFHLYLLRILYLTARTIWGTNHGDIFGVDALGWVWVWYLGLIVPLYFPTRWFSNLKKRRKDIWRLKYL